VRVFQPKMRRSLSLSAEPSTPHSLGPLPAALAGSLGPPRPPAPGGTRVCRAGSVGSGNENPAPLRFGHLVAAFPSSDILNKYKESLALLGSIRLRDGVEPSDFHQSSIKWNIGCRAPSDWNSLNFNCVFNLTYSCRKEWHYNAKGRSIFLISPRGIDESIRPLDWKHIKALWLGC